MLTTAETRSWLGRTTRSEPYDVTRIDIAKFAHTVGATDPAHFDVQVARLRGYPDVLAPLGYYLIVRQAVPNLVPIDQLRDDGAADDLTPPTTATRRMAGSSLTRFHRRIVAGDAITLVKTVADIAEKSGRSGPLVLVSYALRYLDAAGDPVVSESFVRVLR